LENSSLSGNSATDEDGGGTYDCTLANCLVAGNDAAKSGGGTYGSTLINCTVTGNAALLGGGGTYRGTLANCIVWGNDAAARANYYDSTLSFSCSEPLPAGAGNISANPLFINAAAGDYRLRASSPCLNKGDNARSPGNTDLVGNPRISHGIVDMGAYETSIFANLAIAPDTGAPGDFVTQLAHGENLTISGILQEALLTIAVANGGTVLDQKTCAGDDQAFDLAFPLPEGTHALTITVTDQAGNSNAVEQTVVIDNTAPTAADLALAPDTGAPGDFVTQLANGENLTISGILQEALLTIAIASGETVLGQKPCAGDDQAFAFAFPLGEGTHDLAITTTDRADNSATVELTVVIDNTAPQFAMNLAIAPDTGAKGDFVTQLAHGENLTISGILREALLTIAVANGETTLGQKTCTGDDQAFAIAFPLAEGTHDLTITITDQASNGTSSQLTVTIDNTTLDYNWQNGWNTLYLPFDSMTPETAAALSTLPRFSLAANCYVMTATTPLHTVMWVFCADRTQAPALRGNRTDEPPPDLAQLPPGQWSFFGFGHANDMPLPPGSLAWEWQAGKYVLAQTMRPGHVYCFYREP